MSHSQSNVSADLLVPIGQIHLPYIHVPTVWGVHGAETEQSGSGTVESQNYIEKILAIVKKVFQLVEPTYFI